MLAGTAARWLVAASALTAAACNSTAPSTTSPVGNAATGLRAVDQGFIAQAAYGNAAEVVLGEMAARQAGSEAVRTFGRTMADEHAAANRELAALAATKGFMISGTPDPGRQAVASRLAGLSGTAFDRAYAAQEMVEHDMRLALFDAEARWGHDPDLRAFATKRSNDTERHMEMLHPLMPASTGSSH